MNNVPILIIDDRDLFFEFDASEQPIVKGLPKESPPYRFNLEFHGPVQESTTRDIKARHIFEVYANRIEQLKGGGIVLLDLGLGTVTLTAEELADAETLFSEPLAQLDSSGRNKGLAAGIYLLKKALDNDRWYGELCIVSAHATPTLRKQIEQCLSSQKAGTSVGPAIKVRDLYVRFFGEGIINTGQESESEIIDAAAKKIEEAITWFLRDFTDVWWFLHPPAVGDQNSADREWFPMGAHDPADGSDFNNHLKAVGDRFPNWKPADWAKALVCCSTSARYQVMRNPIDSDSGSRFVCVECLKDFFEDIELEGMEWEDQVQFPTIPAFPFLVAAKEFLNELRKDGEGRITLRKIESDVLGLGVKGRNGWGIASSLWTDMSEQTTVRSGTAIKLFRNALLARTELSDVSQLPRLSGVLSGPVTVAIPWITERFIGLSWKSQIKSIPAMS